MGKKVVVTGAFTVEWDLDEAREDWDSTLTDEQVLAEAVASVEQEWDFYACHADVVLVDGRIS